MTKTLGDELRAKRRKARELGEQERRRREQAEAEEARAVGKALADGIIKGLPRALRKEVKSGHESYRVMKATRLEGTFTAAERHAAYLIEQWARQQNLTFSRGAYRQYEGGEDVEDLWLHWKPVDDWQPRW